MIVDSEGTRYSSAFGLADTDEKTPLTLETRSQIASLTKALVSTVAMQLVEEGCMSLDAPVSRLLPELSDPRVLVGFSEDGAPQLRSARGAITLRQLLTHTAGFGYAFVSQDVLRYFNHLGMPSPGSLDGLKMPLLFDPGEQWEYGVSTDWVGLAIERVTGDKLRHVMKARLFDPLGMPDTAFLDRPAPGSATVHRRSANGGFETSTFFLGGGEFDAGSGGLTSTAPDFARFVRMILRGGEIDGQRILLQKPWMRWQSIRLANCVLVG